MRLLLGNLGVEDSKAFRTMGDLALRERGGGVIGAADIMMIISPINTDIQHMYDLYLSLIRDLLAGPRETGHSDSLILVVTNTVLWIIHGQSRHGRGASL